VSSVEPFTQKHLASGDQAITNIWPVELTVRKNLIAWHADNKNFWFAVMAVWKIWLNRSQIVKRTDWSSYQYGKFHSFHSFFVPSRIYVYKWLYTYHQTYKHAHKLILFHMILLRIEDINDGGSNINRCSVNKCVVNHLRWDQTNHLK
jgi:hypothetical protein